MPQLLRRRRRRSRRPRRLRRRLLPVLLSAILASLLQPCDAQPAFKRKNFQDQVSSGRPVDLSWSGNEGPVRIDLVSGTGQIVLQITANNAENSMSWDPPDTLETGAYLFRIADSTGSADFSAQFQYTSKGMSRESSSPGAGAAARQLTEGEKAGIALGAVAGAVLVAIAMYLLVTWLQGRLRKQAYSREAAHGKQTLPTSQVAYVPTPKPPPHLSPMQMQLQSMPVAAPPPAPGCLHATSPWIAGDGGGGDGTAYNAGYSSIPPHHTTPHDEQPAVRHGGGGFVSPLTPPRAGQQWNAAHQQQQQYPTFSPSPLQHTPSSPRKQRRKQPADYSPTPMRGGGVLFTRVSLASVAGSLRRGTSAAPAELETQANAHEADGTEQQQREDVGFAESPVLGAGEVVVVKSPTGTRRVVRGGWGGGGAASSRRETEESPVLGNLEPLMGRQRGW